MRILRQPNLSAVSIVVSIVLSAIGANAQQAGVYISLGGVGNLCNADLTPGVYSGEIWVGTEFEFRSIRLRVSGQQDLVIGIVGARDGGTMTGNLQTGLEVEFPACRSSGTILDLSVFVITPSNDRTLVVEAAVGKPTIELDDCDGFLMKGTGAYSIYCDLQAMYGPYRPHPPDGAVVVPINQLLSFTGSANYLLLGTDPVLDENDIQCFYWGDPADQCQFPFAPALEPNTTYYWQAYHVCIGCEHGEEGHGDVWSFTTGDKASPVESSTWGRVKTLYRD